MSVEDGIPEEGQATPTQDWEKDYKALQAEYTRTQQTLKSFESDPNALISFIQDKHPDLLAEDEEEDTLPAYEEDDDPVAPIRSQMEKFEAWQAQVEGERAQARFDRDLKTEIGDETLPGKVTDWIKDRTAALGNNPQALKQAVEEYRAFADELRPPTRKPTPPPPQPGTAGEAKTDPRDRNARRARMAAAIEANRQE